MLQMFGLLALPWRYEKYDRIQAVQSRHVLALDPPEDGSGFIALKNSEVLQHLLHTGNHRWANAKPSRRNPHEPE